MTLVRLTDNLKHKGIMFGECGAAYAGRLRIITPPLELSG